MQITVLIEPIAKKRYRARGGEPLPVSVEAASRDEALAKLKKKLQARLKNGAELVLVQVAPGPHPWMEFAGMYQDDPWIDDWKQSVAEYRRKKDAEPDLP